MHGAENPVRNLTGSSYTYIALSCFWVISKSTVLISLQRHITQKSFSDANLVTWMIMVLQFVVKYINGPSVNFMAVVSIDILAWIVTCQIIGPIVLFTKLRHT